MCSVQALGSPSLRLTQGPHCFTNNRGFGCLQMLVACLKADPA